MISWVMTASWIVVLLVSGCAETSKVCLSGLRHCNLACSPFDGSEVVFDECARGIEITDGGMETLVWEGKYESPPRLCIGRTIAYVILAIPRTRGSTSTVPGQPFRAEGILADGIYPFARIAMNCTREESGVDVQRILRVKCDVKAQTLHLRLRTSGPGLEWVHPIQSKEGAGEWSTGLGHIWIVGPWDKREGAGAGNILRRHYLSLSDEGQLLIVTGG
jgi:hypothetical protein